MSGASTITASFRAKKCYEYGNRLRALRNLDHQIIFFESFNRNSYRDFADLNQKLFGELD